MVACTYLYADGGAFTRKLNDRGSKAVRRRRGHIISTPRRAMLSKWFTGLRFSGISCDHPRRARAVDLSVLQSDARIYDWRAIRFAGAARLYISAHGV